MIIIAKEWRILIIPKNALRSNKKERGYDRVQTYPQAEVVVCPSTRALYTNTFRIQIKYMNNRRSQITVYIIVGFFSKSEEVFWLAADTRDWDGLKRIYRRSIVELLGIARIHEIPYISDCNKRVCVNWAGPSSICGFLLRKKWTERRKSTDSMVERNSPLLYYWSRICVTQWEEFGYTYLGDMCNWSDGYLLWKQKNRGWNSPIAKIG